MIVLALAYGVLEEGITTQSLFNPNYLNAHLLDYGFLPSLGIAIPWTIFVLTIHTVWSISVPIALVEVLFSKRRTTPWLGRPGLALTCILFAIGIIATTAITLSTDAFIAPVPQLAGAVIAIIILIIIAFGLKPGEPFDTDTHPAPNARSVGVFALIASSIFMLIPHPPAWWIPVVLYVILGIVTCSSLSGRGPGAGGAIGTGWRSPVGRSHLCLARVPSTFCFPGQFHRR